MASDALISESVEPLQGLNGPSLFPRTIRASTDGPIPSDSKDLNSIHHFMKSLKELRSPEKLRTEAKRIMNGAALLGSNFANIAETVSISDAVAAKGKDKPLERRPGLALGRKRARFSLKPNVSQPLVTLEPTVNVDQLEDPDNFFDAYERLENAQKEIRKQLGDCTNNLNEYKSSTNARRRRPGILGKSYNYKHRYSTLPSENDDSLMSSQEIVEKDAVPSKNDDTLMSSQEIVEQDVLDASKHDSQQNIIEPGLSPSPNVDLQEVELADSTTEVGNNINHILDELLSCNNEDLDGDGALNILQERLHIKSLDIEKLCMPDPHHIGRFDVMDPEKKMPELCNKSPVIDMLLKSVLREPPSEHEQVAHDPINYGASPTPPRNPVASLSSLKNRILQSNPLRDPHSPLKVNVSAPPSVSPVVLINKLQDQVELKDLSVSSKLKSFTDVEIREPTISNMNSLKVINGSSGSLLDLFVDETACRQNADGSSRSNELPDCNVQEETVVGNLKVPQNPTNHEASPTPPRNLVSSLLSLKKRNLQFNPPSNPLSPLKVNRSAPTSVSPVQNIDKLHDQIEMKDSGMSSKLKSSIDIEISEPTLCNVDSQKVINESSGSLTDQLADENSSEKNACGDGQPTEVPDCIVEEAAVVGNLNSNDAMDIPSRMEQFDNEQQSEAHHIRKRKSNREACENRLRKAHPLRKSLAESGTSFETGVRRSKRIRMRPLEYWKGERFLYGRVNESLKLVGVKYISPGKADGALKLKHYISSIDKEILEQLVQH
ncbi:centromere protein C-like [Olea europaea var. sylvestris]|uniref:centromere protein C-like n=1 Tax=Olea europaea var. sylvestris TaxID=158386 RepID=UPI000C1CE434|nr:centromere protein C-like [Olea europaea var. sylvestris]